MFCFVVFLPSEPKYKCEHTLNDQNFLFLGEQTKAFCPARSMNEGGYFSNDILSNCEKGTRKRITP